MQEQLVDKYIEIFTDIVKDAHAQDYIHALIPHPDGLTDINEAYIEDYFNRRGYHCVVTDGCVMIEWSPRMNIQYLK